MGRWASEQNVGVEWIWLDWVIPLRLLWLPSSKCVLFWFFLIQLLKKTYPEPWNSFHQFYAQKALFKVPKICNINFLIENNPPPFLELFRKYFRFGSIIRLLVLQTSLFTFSAEVKGLHSLLTIGKLLLSNKNFKKFVTRDQEKSKRKFPAKTK